MDDKQLRLACLDAAVRTIGNPNHIQQAREYYAFVTEAVVTTDTDAVNASEEPKTTTTPLKGQKGNRK
jgi:hypothetical protein